mmetsp:Transcript_60726/g.166767  ORF Transcript_60726/g.166767 Transcript_60726/m.166767 type:complete len:295 (-) Transcript_60726:140-1024(-)
MMPALVKLGGRPEVTDDGDIVYVFDDLLSSSGRIEAALPSEPSRGSYWETGASGLRSASTSGGDSSLAPLIEEKRTFSNAPKGHLMVAGALGAIDLAGVLYLGQLGLPSLGGNIRKLYFGLLAYGLAFNGIPLARWLRNKRKNRAIEARNQKRQEWAALLAESDFGEEGAARLESVGVGSSELSTGGGKRAALRRKLRAARGFGQRLRRVGKDTNIAYSTGKTLLENDQAAGTGLYGFDDFDAKLAAKEPKEPASNGELGGSGVASESAGGSFDDFDARLAAKERSQKPQPPPE